MPQSAYCMLSWLNSVHMLEASPSWQPIADVKTDKPHVPAFSQAPSCMQQSMQFSRSHKKLTQGSRDAGRGVGECARWLTVPARTRFMCLPSAANRASDFTQDTWRHAKGCHTLLTLTPGNLTEVDDVLQCCTRSVLHTAKGWQRQCGQLLLLQRQTRHLGGRIGTEQLLSSCLLLFELFPHCPRDLGWLLYSHPR